MPIARVLAVGALAVAVGLLLWVLSNIHNGSSTASTGSTGVSSAHTSPPPSGGSTGSGKSKAKSTTIPWRSIHLSVYNGYDPAAPAAGDAQATLTAAGWKVDGIGDTNPATGTTATYIAYPPGDHAAAKVVGKKLHITKIVPISQAVGVPSTVTTVTIVLGPDNLPSSSG